jgi:beta-galactosidase
VKENMKKTAGWIVLCALAVSSLAMALNGAGGTPAAEAQHKIAALNALIAQAEKGGLDALKEKMTVRTAEVFLKFADWDEANPEINADYFKQARGYKGTAAQMADELPDFERRDVITMLDSATEMLEQLIAGTVIRKATPNIDWAKVTHDEDQLTYEGRPVFLTDWTWKPRTPELNEYHGRQDGFFLSHSYVQTEEGAINPRILNELKSKPDGKMGFIFLNHKGAPKWTEQKYGPGFAMREETYTAYDIDNPGAREINRLLLAGTVPYMAGKKYSQLGYMLCNEPHFFTTEGVWATGPVSNFTIEKFKLWLKARHQSIAILNELWGSSFVNFDAVEITIPISAGLQGTPKWFDWVAFNMDRVTDWYQFLKDEIRRHDPAAKVHLKVMPNLWTDNKRNHGLDFEALTRLSDIIGNDTGAAHALMWGKGEWEEHYAFEWREMAMGHDFFKSVSPDKIMFNTESHFLSTVKSRDLYLDPQCARAMFWLAHTQGLNVSQNWFWARREDGSIRNGAGKGYAGSNNQQPRVVNEVHSTLMDLNAYAEEITAMQRQKKPIRIFYTKASAINKPQHMDDVFELYESLYFEGVPLGFVTRDILSREDTRDWDVILVRKTEFATAEDLAALQAYVDAGGTVIADGVSLKKDEYGRPLPGLFGSIVRTDSLEEMTSTALRMIDVPVVVTETNSGGTKGCTWKYVENAAGNPVLSIVNVGKTDATLKIALKGAATGTACKNILTGQPMTSTPVLKPYGVLFIEVTEAK